MVIAAIKQNGKEKLLALCHRDRNGKLGESVLCDWNTVPNTLRIFNRSSSKDIKFCSFKECVKYIFSL